MSDECVLLEEGFCACHGPQAMQFVIDGKPVTSARVNGIVFQNFEFRRPDGSVVAELNLLILHDLNDNTAYHVPLDAESMREIASGLIERARQLEPKSGLN